MKQMKERQLMKERKLMVEVTDLKKIYQLGDEKVAALGGVNLGIYAGEIFAIFGTSGSGKSTLLNQLAGLEKPTSGSILVRGARIDKMDERSLASFRQRHVGFVFQSYNLLPFLTATENVALPLSFRGISEKKRMQVAVSMLKRVGLGHRLNHYPNQMSGGQQQRVGIARAFVARPAVVFADEPTGNLDSKTTTEVMDMIRRFSRELGQTIILVTHDPEMAAYADRILTLVDGLVVDIKNGRRKDEYDEQDSKEGA